MHVKLAFKAQITGMLEKVYVGQLWLFHLCAKITYHYTKQWREMDVLYPIKLVSPQNLQMKNSKSKFFSLLQVPFVLIRRVLQISYKKK